MRTILLAIIMALSLASCQMTRIDIIAYVDNNSTITVWACQPKSVSASGKVQLSLMPGL